MHQNLAYKASEMASRLAQKVHKNITFKTSSYMPFLPKTPNKVFHVTMSGAHPDACIQDHNQGFNNKEL
jgi:hypothetical protein